MKNGNWIPISRFFTKHLPRDRPYTKLEAAYCLQLDYAAVKPVTISGYAKLWQWSIGKVYRFFEEMNVKIKYPEDTKNIQNQNGMITNMITERNRNDNGMIRLIENSYLQDETERNRNDNGMITERSRTATINTRIINKKKNIKKRDIRAREFIPPSENDVISYFIENGYSEETAHKAFAYYDTAGWKDSRGKQVNNWKQKMIAVWFKDENNRTRTTVDDIHLKNIRAFSDAKQMLFGKQEVKSESE